MSRNTKNSSGRFVFGPYYDAVDVMALPNTQEQVYYSGPMPGRTALIGLHFNNSSFDLTQLSIGVQDTSDEPVWTPERVPVYAILAQQSLADPVSLFIRPYVLERGQRVQFKLQNDSAGGLNVGTRITLVCARLPEVDA